MEYNITPQLDSNGLTVAELFCGGGLMAVGMKAAGYNIIWANDFNKNAFISYAKNIGDHVVLGDITSNEIINMIPDVDIIAGGPPCQDYSIAGSNEGEEGDKGRLVYNYLSIIWQKQPKAFIFENVKNLVQKSHIHTFHALLSQMEHIGYKVSWKVVNSWDHGVAQKRERVFIIGIREDLGIKFKFPDPDNENYRNKVLFDVIGDLPEPEEQINGGHLSNNFDTKFEMSNRVSPYFDPSATVTAHHRCAYIHPIQKRRFTVRECLRIQSVPDWYVIPDRISLSASYQIVGNGVASKVAYDLGIALADQLRGVINLKA